MAMSATLTINPSVVVPGQAVACNLVVSNSSGSPVPMISVQPFAEPVGSTSQSVGASVGLCQIAPSAATVPAGGSSTFHWDVVPLAPMASGTATLNLGAQCLAGDGGVFGPTPQALTVNAPTH